MRTTEREAGWKRTCKLTSCLPHFLISFLLFSVCSAQDEKPTPQFTNRLPTGASRNLIPNASFECGTDGWSTLSKRTGWGPGLSGLFGRVVQGNAWHGNRSMQVDLGPGKTPVTTFNMFPVNRVIHRRLLAANLGWLEVEKGEVYTLSAFLRADRVGVPAQLLLRFSSPLATSIDRSNDAYSVHPFRMYPRYVRLTTGWKRYSFSVRAPDRYAFAAVGPDLSDVPDTAATVWIDAVQLEKGEPVYPFEPRETVEIGFNSGKFGNVFQKGEPLRLTVDTTNHSSEETALEVRLVVRNFFDTVVSDSTKTLTIPAVDRAVIGATTTEWSLPLSEPGFYQLHASWKGDSGVGSEKTKRLAIIEPYTHADSVFGINHAPADSRVCEHLRRVGFVWARDWSMNWQHLEPEPGKFRFDVADAHVDRVLGTGMRMMCMLPPWPSSDWASEATDDLEQRWAPHSRIWWRMAYAPKDRDAFARFVKTVARRYQGRIRNWEYLNEPLGPYITLPSGPPSRAGYTVADYVALLKVQYAAVKQSDPKSKVIGGLGGETHSAKSFFDAGGLDFVDVFNLHIYPGKSRPEVYVSRMEEVLRAMDATRAGRKPIWITEYAYSGTDTLPWRPYVLGPMEWQPPLLEDERELASYAVRFAAIMLAHGVEKIFYHYGGAMGSEPNDFEEVLQSGVLVHAGAPRKLYVAQSVLANLLGPQPQYVAQLGRPKVEGRKPLHSVYGYSFQCQERTVVIAWSPKIEASDWRLEVSPADESAPEVYDIMGAEIQGTRFQLGESPIYVVSDSLPAADLVESCRLFERAEDEK